MISAAGSLIMMVFSENLIALIIGIVINAIGLVPLQAGLSAIVADVGDLVYWKSGVPVQGSVFSLTSAGMKIGQGLTSALVGWALQIGGYVGQCRRPVGKCRFRDQVDVYVFSVPRHSLDARGAHVVGL